MILFGFALEAGFCNTILKPAREIELLGFVTDLVDMIFSNKLNT